MIKNIKNKIGGVAMFKLKFAKMFDNSIFTKYGLAPVAEDAYQVEENSFCVADGVTRDNIYGQAVPYPKTKEETIKWVKSYPNPSGAYEAARVTAKTFVEQIQNKAEEQINKEVIRKAVEKANEAVAKLNKDRIIDYIKEDYYCCEAVGGRIVNNQLYAFSIGDCHITLLDENYQIVFTTINNHKRFEEFLDNYTQEHGFDWNDVNCRIMVRKDYRNKPHKIENGKEVSFGAISGEEEALYFVDTYQVDLTNVKYICAYSDGYEPFFETKQNIQKLLENPINSQREGKERTLILYEKEQ